MRNRSKSVFVQREAELTEIRKPAYSDAEEADSYDDEETSTPNVKQWSYEEKLTLLRQLDEHIPKLDTNYLRTLAKIDWSKFEIGSHSADDIKEQVNWLIKPIRKTRSLREIISDCNVDTMLKCHEDLPKRPPTAFHLFSRDKYQTVQAEMPNEKPPGIMKKISELYAALPTKKRHKYNQRAEALMQDYKKAMEKFSQDHPEFTEQKKPSTKKEVKKGKRQPMDLYIEELKSKKQYSNYAHARKQWSLLPMASKVVYIKEHLLSNNEKPRTEVLTKVELALLDKFDGKPVKPMLAYHVFCNEIRQEFAGQPFAVVQKEMAERWKNLSEEAKSAYQRAHQEAMKKYKREMDEYLSKLPAEERKRLVEQQKAGRKQAKPQETTDGGEKKKKKVKAKLSNGSVGSEEEVQNTEKSATQESPVAKPSPAANIGVYSFAESESDGTQKKKKKKKATKETVVEETHYEDQPSSSGESKKKKKKKNREKEAEPVVEPEPEPEPEPDTLTKKRKKDKVREEEFVAPSPKKRKDTDESSASGSSSPKKKKKRSMLQRPPKNTFTFFVLNYCDQDHDVAVSEWKAMTYAQRKAVKSEWSAEKKKFIQELQERIVSSQTGGADFSEEDILACPAKYSEPESD